MRYLTSISLTALLALGACDGGAEVGDGPDAGAAGEPDAQTQPDPTDAFYDPGHIVEVAIEMNEVDWDTVRTQARSFELLVGSDCQDQPFAKPYEYKPATVTVDGEVVDSAGVRKKGFFGSLDPNKPSLKIKLDLYEPETKLFGTSRITLNNARQDPAFIKQCLGYQLFAAAGIPAPRCNFAHVTINGRNLGLFANIEAVKKPFLRRHYADDEGNLYEGTLSDFRPGWMGTFEKKTNKTILEQPEVNELATALLAPDSQLLAKLDALMDVDEFINFWATEVLIAHWDGYANNTNNFFVYRDPSTNRLTFMPWGIDGILEDANPFPDGVAPPKAVFATGLLARRLYLLPETRDKYIARLRALLDTVWKVDSLLTEIDRMESLVIDIAKDDPFADGVDVPAEIEKIRQFVRDRRSMLTPELDTPRTWDYELRDSFCFAERGTIAGTFATTWGDLERDPFTTGVGTLTATIDSTLWLTQAVGSKAGMNLEGDNGPRAQVQVVAWLQNGNFAVFAVDVDPQSFTAGTVSFDLNTTAGWVIEWNASTEEGSVVGFLANGTLRLDAASLVDGAQVSGSFSGDVVEFPF